MLESIKNIEVIRNEIIERNSTEERDIRKDVIFLDNLNSLNFLQTINDSISTGDYRKINQILSDIQSEVHSHPDFVYADYYALAHPILFRAIGSFKDYKRIKNPTLSYRDFMKSMARLVSALYGEDEVELEDIITRYEEDEYHKAFFLTEIDSIEAHNKKPSLETLRTLLCFGANDFLKRLNHNLYDEQTSKGNFIFEELFLKSVQKANLPRRRLQELLIKEFTLVVTEDENEYYSWYSVPFFTYSEYISFMFVLINSVANKQFISIKETMNEFCRFHNGDVGTQ